MTDAEMRQMAREALAEALTRMGLTLSPEAMGNRSLALAEITDRITGATVPTPRAKFFSADKSGFEPEETRPKQRPTQDFETRSRSRVP